MRQEYQDAIRKHLHEIILEDDLFNDVSVIEIADWWHYFPNTAINVHDYNEDGIIEVDVYNSTDETGIIYDTIQESYSFTLEELKKL
jgi:hypothetical protein